MTFNYSMTKLTRLLSFNSSDRVEVCDNIHYNISSVTKSVLKHVTNHSSTRKESSRLQWFLFRRRKVSLIGLFTIAFAASILQGISHTEFCFDKSRMREHLIECLEKDKLSVLPKQASVVVNKG